MGLNPSQSKDWETIQKLMASGVSQADATKKVGKSRSYYFHLKRAASGNPYTKEKPKRKYVRKIQITTAAVTRKSENKLIPLLRSQLHVMNEILILAEGNNGSITECKSPGWRFL